MVRPIIKHPIESIKYMVEATIPAIALGYISQQYKKTHDERLLTAHNYFSDKLKSIAEKHYSKIDPKRIPTLIAQLDNLESKLKK